MKYIIIILVIVLVIGVALIVFKKISRAARGISSSIREVNTLFNNVKEATSSIKQMQEDGTFEEPKSVGGATQVYLKKVLNDFPQFHNDDAQSEIKQVIENYLYYRYGKDESFNTELVNQNLFQDLKKASSGTIENIKFNGIAIYGYLKSREYATIDYKCSVGFDLDGKRKETRYAVKYTNQLSDHEIASVGMKCPNCGAPIGTNDLQCPYCGAKIIKDTIMNWAVTQIEQEYSI